MVADCEVSSETGKVGALQPHLGPKRHRKVLSSSSQRCAFFQEEKSGVCLISYSTVHSTIDSIRRLVITLACTWKIPTSYFDTHTHTHTHNTHNTHGPSPVAKKKTSQKLLRQYPTVPPFTILTRYYNQTSPMNSSSSSIYSITVRNKKANESSQVSLTTTFKVSSSADRGLNQNITCGWLTRRLPFRRLYVLKHEVDFKWSPDSYYPSDGGSV